jgi:hypothetical protein
MLKHYEDSKKYLTEHPELVCDETANYLVVWCIDLEIEEVNWLAYYELFFLLIFLLIIS